VLAIVFLEPGRRPRRRQLVDAIRAFAPAGVLFGVAYIALVAGFDTGRGGIVSPLNATQSLWAVAFSALLLGRADGVGPRVVAAGACVVPAVAAIGVAR
jgi:drug/metabolite transporter (DMT)-like permease